LLEAVVPEHWATGLKFGDCEEIVDLFDRERAVLQGNDQFTYPSKISETASLSIVEIQPFVSLLRGVDIGLV
jgi:hypothetical protein